MHSVGQRILTRHAVYVCTDIHVLHICVYVTSKTSAMWASASSDMFSINITKTKQQHKTKAEQNKMRGGGSERKIPDKKLLMTVQGSDYG